MLQRSELRSNSSFFSWYQIFKNCTMNNGGFFSHIRMWVISFLFWMIRIIPIPIFVPCGLGVHRASLCPGLFAWLFVSSWSPLPSTPPPSSQVLVSSTVYSGCHKILFPNESVMDVNTITCTFFHCELKSCKFFTNTTLF